MRIFLGGTCNDSTWRDELMPLLDDANIDYFNPVVKDWDDKAYQNELKERQKCDVCLYVITPQMTGVYSIAEVVDDSNKRSEKAVLCVLKKAKGDEFNKAQAKSLDSVVKMVEDNGSKAFSDLKGLMVYLKELDTKLANFPLFKSL